MLENNQEISAPLLIKDLGLQFTSETKKYRKRFGLYKCFCGNEFKTTISSINRGNTKSCGCFRREIAQKSKTTHGLRHHRLYDVWKQMVQRTSNPEHKYFKNYGGRGISVCDRWQCIKAFVEDMAPTYSEGLSIDRIDNDGDYEVNNCRWVHMSVQNRNTRRIISSNTSGYRGVSFSREHNKWKAKIGIDYKSIYLGYFKTALDAAKAYDKYVIDNNLEHTKNFE